MFRKAPGVVLASVVLLGAAATAFAGVDTWYTGMRAFGQVTVEPAVDYMTGNEVFLLTPNKAPFPSKANAVATAPLYLVAYPTSSTITDALNCTPTTCDHAQRIPVPWYPDGGLLKGHDHLVGIANTHGDFNIAWKVELDFFTQKGFSDGAINHRILTLTDLDNAKKAGDIAPMDIGVTFNCSATNSAVYAHGTPLTFTP